MTTAWHDAVYSVIRDSSMQVLGQEDIKNHAHASVVIATIKAFGNCAAAFLYIEPCTARSSYRPPDVLLCHPDVGLLVIEVKGHAIGDINGIEAGNLMIQREGFIRPLNPFRQAEDAMFQIKNDIERYTRAPNKVPLTNILIAFPNISLAEWKSKGYDRCLPLEHIVFKEDITDHSRLKSHILKFVTTSLKESHKPSPVNPDDIKAIKTIFGDSGVVNVKPEERSIRAEVPEEKLGAYVDELMSLEKYLSEEQQELSRAEIGEHPRLIRGVAGSGKTIVLANMAARYINRSLRAQLQKDFIKTCEGRPRVAITCFNRSLVKFIAKKTRDSFYQQTLENIPPNILQVNYFNGFLWNLINEEGLQIDYIPADSGSSQQRAQKYLASLRKFSVENPEAFELYKFDAIFVDEGQDFVEEEYQILMELIKPHPLTEEKPLIIFYDDAQNLYGRQRPNWKEIGIDVLSRTRVMRECFRNTREIIEFAFNMLLGAQCGDEKGPETRTYADLAYLKQINLVEEHSGYFEVKFAERRFKKPMIRGFLSRIDEFNYLNDEIARLIKEENVRSEDILVLFYGPQKSEFASLKSKLESLDGHIKGFMLPYGQNDDKDSYIFRPDYLTISTVNGAKGYDAQAVFLIGVDLFDRDKPGRAAFYVGASRAKLMLYITGIQGKNSLFDEAVKLDGILHR